MKHIRATIKPLDMTLIALFAALIAVCSWVTVPMTVPVTLQTFAVFFAAAFLGWRRGFVCVLLYLALGAVGVPVFSGFRGGVGVLLGNTGGYLVGFLFAVLLFGVLTEYTGAFGRSVAGRFTAALAGLAVCYAFGTVWFLIVYTRTVGAVGIVSVLSWCVFPFILPDLAKIALALFLAARLKRFR